jgi:quercetin dioxygenase-like cupin family protein
MNACFWTPSAGALRRTFHVAGVLALFVGMTPVKADLNPAAIMIEHANQIKWTEGNGGNATAILAGDPSKPGIYVELTKWHPHHMSRPHFHPNDRYIYVISGTWWVGTGTKYDPDSTVPVPAGSYVTHYAKQVHYDGAKDEEVVLEIVGEGPATSTGAEQK